ncbi:MAG: DUF6152 family protein [Candidatus Rariloculaceae bacterium]
MKLSKSPTILISVVFLLGASLASAHHAVQAQFDVSDVRTFTGVMTQVEMINPHPYFHVDVETSGGAVENWALEAPALNVLRRAGMVKSLRVGESYTVDYNPARNGEKIGLMLAVTLPDGNRLEMRSIDPALRQ